MVSSMTRIRRMEARSSSGPGNQTTWWLVVLNVFALGQLPHLRAIRLDQPAAEAERRTAARREARLGQARRA